jgi:hypothetical protein
LLVAVLVPRASVRFSRLLEALVAPAGFSVAGRNVVLPPLREIGNSVQPKSARNRHNCPNMLTILARNRRKRRSSSTAWLTI